MFLGIAKIKTVRRGNRFAYIPYTSNGRFASKRDAASVLTFSKVLTIMILSLMIISQVNSFVLELLSTIDLSMKFTIAVFFVTYTYFDFFRTLY